MKFCRVISYSFQVIEQTRFCDRQTDRQTQRENNITAFHLHNNEMFNKMTNSTYGYNVLDKHYHYNEPVVPLGVLGQSDAPF